jgi:hypothetical protein
MAKDKPQDISLPARENDGIGPHDEVLPFHEKKYLWNAENGVATIERE